MPTERETASPPEAHGHGLDIASLADRLRQRHLLPSSRPAPSSEPQPAAESEEPEPADRAEAAAPAPPRPPHVLTLRLQLPPWDWEPDVDTRPIAVNREARLLLAVVTFAYIWLFSYWTMRNHDGFGSFAFDLGIFDQGVWLLSRFKEPFVTVRGLHLFGDHTSFILLPLVPIYWLVPSAKVLLVAQAFALGLGAVPTFLLAREKLRNELLAVVLAVVYLLHPAVGHINLEQFHPDAFEVPLVLFALWFMVRHKWTGYFVCVAALLLVKEDVALLTLPLGIYVALRHDRRVGVATCQVSILAMVAALWWILPMYNEVGSLNAWRVPFGGPGGLVRTTLAHPGRLVDYLFQDGRPWYVWQMLSPLAFLPVLAPRVLLIGLLPLAANVVSTFPYQYDIHYHYGTLVVPVLVASTIYAIAKANSLAGRQVAVGLVAASTLVAAYMWGPTPLGRQEAPIANPDDQSIPHRKRAMALIPDDAVVSAQYSFVPHLGHRDEIYMFPNPFSASYWSTAEQEGQRLPQADRVEYLILPTVLDAEPQAVFERIRPEFAIVYEAGDVRLLKRKPPPG